MTLYRMKYARICAAQAFCGAIGMRARFLSPIIRCETPMRPPCWTPAAARDTTGAGFAITCERGLWRIDLSPWRQAALIDSLPRRSLPARVPDELLPLLSLCRSLLSQGDVPARDQPWPPIRQTLLLLAAGDRQRLWQTLSAQTALCKRTHAPLPAAAAYAIMEDTLGKEGETILS